MLWNHYLRQIDNIDRMQQASLSKVELQIMSYFKNVEQLLEDTNRFRDFHLLDDAEKRNVLYLLLSERKYFTHVTYLNLETRKSITLSNRQIALNEAVKESMSEKALRLVQTGTEFNYSAVYNDKEIAEPLLTVSYMLKDLRTDRIMGVLMADVRFKPIWELFAELMYDAGQDIYLTDGMNRIVSHRDPSVVFAATVSSVRASGYQHDVWGDKVFSNVQEMQLGEQTFKIVANTKYNSIIAPFIVEAMVIAGAVLIIMLCAAMLFWYISEKVIKPIDDINDTIERFKNGDLETRINMEQSDEIGELARNFDGMAYEVMKSQQHMSNANEILEAEVEARTSALVAANKKLKDLDRLKSMFIAMMSHELRTPLNSIIGFTGLMRKKMIGEINEQQEDYLKRVETAGTHLLALISDVIDISKIEAGRSEAEPDYFDLGDLIKEAVNETKGLIGEKNLSISYTLPSIELHTDRRRMMQALLNYLSNAVKFSEEGSIIVTASDEGEEVRISVQDTGIGVSEEHLETLFTAFERIDSHLSISAGGTGLGLYLTKKIVEEILGGQVFVESEVGKGSTFGLVIPKSFDTK
ncbi:MAG: ATP-binding protein [Sulfurimonadaceae bacterium]|nr:ATP-binding protein [Sulfurimonadaceae bacterium]